MKRNLLYRLLPIALLAAPIGSLNAETARKPNVIFILADDLGYGDPSCYGQTKFRTPHIDSLAERGMRFTQAYSGSTVCAPSRCALLTGMHMGHAAVRGNDERKDGEGQAPMPADTFTVAKLMKEAGYTTGIFGKWGLGYPGSASEPLKMGFDRFYGYNCQRLAHSYYPEYLWSDGKREMLDGNAGGKRGTYAPELIHAQAIEFIRENKDRPFFCYYAAVQPHADMVAPEEYMARFRGKYLPEKAHADGYYMDQPEAHAAFVAMVTVLDDHVGGVMAELDKLGIADDTLVIFSSDNGPHQEGGADPDYFNSNGVLKGYKRDLYEGGVRVPFIATWPGKIKAGTVSEHLCAFWDFLPTISELVEKPVPVKVDGVSFLPTLLGRDGQKPRDYLYWEFSEKKGRVAMRKGKWKAVRYNVSVDPDSPLELYDLSADPGEENNVAGGNPEVVDEMDKLMRQARVPSPNPNFNPTGNTAPEKE